MPSAVQHIAINATPETVMAVITDFERYPEFLPEIQQVELERDDGDRWDVRFIVHIIRRLDYKLSLVRRSDGLRWSLVEGLFTSNDGYWQLKDVGDRNGPRTEVTYGIDLVLGVFVPRALVNSLVGERLPATLARFKARAEAQQALQAAAGPDQGRPDPEESDPRSS